MDYEEHETPIGTFVFGNIVGPPEPDIKGDNLQWLCGFRLENEKCDTLLSNIDAVIIKCREETPSFPADMEKLKLPFGPAKDLDPDDPKGDKIDSMTHQIVKFKRKLEYKEKKTGRIRQRSAPSIYDASGAPVNDRVKEVNWATTGRVFYKVIPYIYMKKPGITLTLEGFQIKELASGMDVSGPVAPIEGGGWTAPPSNEIDLNGEESGGNFFELDE